MNFVSEFIIAIASVKITQTEAGVMTEFKLWDKMKALEQLSRHLGLFEKDNNQQSNNNAINIINLGNGIPPEADI